jgi:hypothetical protein
MITIKKYPVEYADFYIKRRKSVFYIKERNEGLFVIFKIYNLISAEPLCADYSLIFTDERKEATMFSFGSDAISILNKCKLSEGVYDVHCNDTRKILFTLYNE